MTSGKLVGKLTKIPNGYKSGIPWSIKPVKVPLIKMEDRPPFDIWNWKLSTRPWPQLNCQNVLFLKRRPQLLRAGRRRDKNLILICHLSLEERWAEFAQLFTFYWDLTKNKFSFPLSFIVTRSPLFVLTSCRRHIGIWKESIRRSPGVPVKLGEVGWWAWMDRRPPGTGASAISPTFEWVITGHTSEINCNFQRAI